MLSKSYFIKQCQKFHSSYPPLKTNKTKNKQKNKDNPSMSKTQHKKNPLISLKSLLNDYYKNFNIDVTSKDNFVSCKFSKC